MDRPRNAVNRIAAPVALAAALLGACSGSGPARELTGEAARNPASDPTGPPAIASALEPSIRRGLACVARDYDGNSFRDDYLQYEYPGEAVDSPLDGYRLTYRILDAYYIVVMLRQAGMAPGEAGTLFDRAEAVTAALVPAWRAKGIYNLRRNPVDGGIALDTYAILAVLRRDAAMGRVVEAGLDGDGWLPADFYVGDEAFRILADESWAARAVLIADPPGGLDAVRRIGRQALRGLDTESNPLARANIVIHALGALGDLPPSVGSDDAELVNLIPPLRQEGLRLLRVEEVRYDTVTLGNLVGALISGGAVTADTIAPAIQDLAGRQSADGCWSGSLDPNDTSGRVFSTLRVALTLGQYATLRGGTHPPPGK
jgi:hypothetical protein